MKVYDWRLSRFHAIEEMLQLIQKKLIALESLECLLFWNGIPSLEYSNSQFMKVHHHAAVVADYFALPRWWRLQIILVQLNWQ